MKFRNQSLKYVLQEENGEFGGAGGSGQQASQQASAQDAAPSYATLYTQEPNPAPNANSQMQNTQYAVAQPQQPQQSPQQQMRAHLDSLNLMQNVDMANAFTAAQSGDMQSFNGAMQAALENVYTSMLGSVNELMKKQEQRILDQSKNNSSATVAAQRAFDTLEAEIPISKDKTFGPTIKKVFQDAMVQTKGDATAAVKMTKDYMTDMTKQLAKMNGQVFVDPNTTDGQQFQQQQSASGTFDALSILTEGANSFNK